MLRWNRSADEIVSNARTLIADAIKVQDKVAAMPVEQATFDSCILPLAFSEGIIYKWLLVY